MKRTADLGLREESTGPSPAPLGGLGCSLSLCLCAWRAPRNEGKEGHGASSWRRGVLSLGSASVKRGCAPLLHQHIRQGGPEASVDPHSGLAGAADQYLGAPTVGHAGGQHQGGPGELCGHWACRCVSLCGSKPGPQTTHWGSLFMCSHICFPQVSMSGFPLKMPDFTLQIGI